MTARGRLRPDDPGISFVDLMQDSRNYGTSGHERWACMSAAEGASIEYSAKAHIRKEEVVATVVTSAANCSPHDYLEIDQVDSNFFRKSLQEKTRIRSTESEAVR
jgi:hypothetical protein